jgi:hypothetical protein
MPGRLLAAVTTIGLLAVPLLGSTADAQTATTARVTASKPALRVMTRNLYVGTDIMRPLRAIAGISDPQQLVVALAHATDEARDIVDQTNFGVRSRLLAEEIAGKKPDLVGLQEVALWRSGPLELDPAKIAVPNATEVDYDFLKMLLRKLRAAGVRYRPVSVNSLSDVEAPAFTGTPPAIADARDVRLTVSDVILKRVGSGIKVLRHHERDYRHNLQLDIAGKALDFTRGYQWVDVQRGHKRFRFINTHLEAFSSDIAYQQAAQMLAGPGDTRRTTIIVCDCNSDPLNGTVKPIDTRPHWAPYWLITGKHGYNDTWLQWKQAQYGWTSGLSELVNDPTAAGFDHRIDMVFGRTGDGRRLRVVGGAVTGNTVASRDATTGLWPSDHAGVVMRLRGL